MHWKKNKKLLARGFHDLEYLPRDRCGWDCTLSSLAYGLRAALASRTPDLNAWAARHGAQASVRYAEFGGDAMVLWHGTSLPRAEKISEHGLFHKRGLWTTLNPFTAHSYCRGRSARFDTEGAMICLVLDRREILEGRDFEFEGREGNILRFHCRLPAEVVEYVLTNQEIRFTGPRRALHAAPWPDARFKEENGKWVPIRQTPVRYSDEASYSSLREFLELSLEHLLTEVDETTALEIFSVLYAMVRPWEALSHGEIFALIEEQCIACPKRHRWQTFRAAKTLVED
jgi:hypothetical protein